MFDVQSPTTHGILALDADASLPEQSRGMLLAAAGVKTAEKTPGHGDFGISKLSEPANALFWKHMSPGPKSAWGSWTFAMPARHLGGDRYRPLGVPGSIDGDFREETIVSASGWGGTPPVGADAIILSTTAHGNHKKLAFAVGSGRGGGSSFLISHWNPDNPPALSSHVSDVDGSSPDPLRHAGLDTIFRVRRWAPPCSGATAVPGDEERQYTIALTGNASPEGQGFLHTTYGQFDALHSHLMGGSLRPATKKHNIVHTGDAFLRQGAIDTNALFTSGKYPYDAPLEFVEKPYPEAQKGSNPVKVELLYDDTEQHTGACGLKNGKWKWVAWIPIEETPPCDASKSTKTDTNNNPKRTYSDSTRIWADRKYQSQGMYFQPRSDIMEGPMSNMDKRRV